MSRRIAAVYRRVSTSEQQYGMSLDSQLAECVNRGDADGYEVPDHLIFTDIMSGTRADRPQFLAMLEAGRQKKFGRLYVWSLDRLGRTMRDSVNAVADLQGWDISVLSTREGELSEPVLLGVLAGVAEREHRRIKERTLPPKMAKKQAGLWVVGSAPYGFTIAANKSLAVCPVEATVVRRIFDLAISGMGRIQIARKLNAEQLPPPEARVRMPDRRVRRIRIGHHGAPEDFRAWCNLVGAELLGLPQWQTSTVAKVLSNPAACGRLHPTEMRDGKRVQLAPIKLAIDMPIVSDSEFQAARKALEGRHNAGKAANLALWLLTGILTCSACGSSYRHHAGRRDDHRYVCSGRKSGKICKNPSIKTAEAERQVVREVRATLRREHPDPELFANFVSQRARTSANEIAAAEQKAREDRDAGQAQRDSLEAQLHRYAALGLEDADLRGHAAALKAARQTYEAKEKHHQSLITDLIRARAGLEASERDVEEVARRMFDALDLIAGSGEDGRELLTDVRAVLANVVTSAKVQPDGNVQVEVDSSGNAMIRLISMMATEKAGELKADRLVGAAA